MQIEVVAARVALLELVPDLGRGLWIALGAAALVFVVSRRVPGHPAALLVLLAGVLLGTGEPVRIFVVRKPG